jgi:NAD(P)-dependent dehydrogenase (short-subunit alcohol dehydrogenase family)
MAETFAKSGHRVFASMRDPAGVNRERANALWAQGIDVVALDVTDDGSVDNAIRTVLGKTARIDVLVNNADIVLAGVTEAFSAAQFHDVLDTNVVGLLRMVRAVLPGMRQAGDGLIINVGSIMGRLTVPFFGLYGASKFAIEALTESLRYEVLPFGVDVVLVQPSIQFLSMYASAQKPADRGRESYYIEIGLQPGAALQRISTSLTDEGNPNSRDVSIALTKLVDAQPGARPMRTIVGCPYGADEVNNAIDLIQRRFLDTLDLA